MVAALLLHPLGLGLAKNVKPKFAGGGSLDVISVTAIDTPVAHPVEAPPPAPHPAEPPPMAKLPEPMPAPPPAATKPIAEKAEKAVEAAAALLGAAAKALVRDDDPEAVPAIASGDGDATFGVVAAAGAGTATLDVRAALAGRAKGRGDSTSPNAIVGPDHSRSAVVVGGYTNDCDFPIEAAGIDDAVAVVVVSVRPDGTASDVVIVGDPGHGFGRAARTCALRRKYRPALDHDGHAVAAVTAPVRVRFTR